MSCYCYDTAVSSLRREAVRQVTKNRASRARIRESSAAFPWAISRFTRDSNTLRMLFLSRGETGPRCASDAGGDETPAESSTTSLNARRQVCLLPGTAVGPRCTFAKFRFLSARGKPVSLRYIYIYIYIYYASRVRHEI